MAKENRFHVVVFFPPDTGLRPRHMYFSDRSSPGNIVDVVHRLVPQFERLAQGEGRYCVYGVKHDGSGVNLLPYITPVRELHVLQRGDFLVLSKSEQGLEEDCMPGFVGGGGTVTATGGGRKFKAAADKCTVA